MTCYLHNKWWTIIQCIYRAVVTTIHSISTLNHLPQSTLKFNDVLYCNISRMIYSQLLELVQPKFVTTKNLSTSVLVFFFLFLCFFTTAWCTTTVAAFTWTTLSFTGHLKQNKNDLYIYLMISNSKYEEICKKVQLYYSYSCQFI